MVDSIAVLPPGWRAFNDRGELVSDASLSFTLAGTTTPMLVYSDANLTIPLGSIVACNNAGYPVTGANAKTLIYVGEDPYKIRLSSALEGTIAEHDFVRGALDTSVFLTAAFAPFHTVVTEASDRAVGATDRGKLIEVNVSAAVRTMTIAAASVLGNGWWVGIQHDGTANQVEIAGNGTDLFTLNGVATTGFSLAGKGQVVYLACDGAGFKVYSQAEALIAGNTSIITIADRLSAPPGAPTGGQRYILTAAPSGAWSGFSEHDIAEATGAGGWFRYVPPADCGWLAYVQDEDRYYSLVGATWKETVVNIGSLTAATAIADGDLFHIERAGVSMKAARPIVANDRFVASGTLSAAATLDLTIPADCDVLELNLWNWLPATDNVALWMRFSQAAAFLVGASDYKWGGDVGAVATNDAADSELEIASVWGNVAGEYGHMHIRIFRPSAAATVKSALWDGAYHNTLGNYIATNGGGELLANTNAIDGVRLMFSSGNIVSGFYAVTAYKYA